MDTWKLETIHQYRLPRWIYERLTPLVDYMLRSQVTYASPIINGMDFPMSTRWKPIDILARTCTFDTLYLRAYASQIIIYL
jgi:hypothetical protein